MGQDQFCLTLFGPGLGMSPVWQRACLLLAQTSWNVLDYNTLSRRQKTLSVVNALILGKPALLTALTWSAMRVRSMHARSKRLGLPQKR
jgi:hypothetical protein